MAKDAIKKIAKINISAPKATFCSKKEGGWDGIGPPFIPRKKKKKIKK